MPYNASTPDTYPTPIVDDLFKSKLAGVKLVVVVSSEQEGAVVVAGALVEPSRWAGAVVREALSHTLAQQSQQAQLDGRAVFNLKHTANTAINLSGNQKPMLMRYNIYY